MKTYTNEEIYDLLKLQRLYLEAEKNKDKKADKSDEIEIEKDNITIKENKIEIEDFYKIMEKIEIQIKKAKLYSGKEIKENEQK